MHTVFPDVPACVIYNPVCTHLLSSTQLTYYNYYILLVMHVISLYSYVAQQYSLIFENIDISWLSTRTICNIFVKEGRLQYILRKNVILTYLFCKTFYVKQAFPVWNMSRYMLQVDTCKMIFHWWILLWETYRWTDAIVNFTAFWEQYYSPVINLYL